MTVVKECRFCLGTIKWVHRSCLDEWVTQREGREGSTRCPICRVEYDRRPRRFNPVTWWNRLHAVLASGMAFLARISDKIDFEIRINYAV